MHPYSTLEARAFWKSAVAGISPFQIAGLWDPKFRIDPDHKIATFGSCFAQHLSRALVREGYNWLDAEQAPFGLSPQSCRAFNYGVFSARTGNIYTTSLLAQWLEWALSPDAASEEVWVEGQRYYDPFRPAIEPNGFASEKEMRLSRAEVLRALKIGMTTSDIFVFTLGLTECWVNRRSSHAYPMCPGVHIGEFDDGLHDFVNHGYRQVIDNLERAFELIRKVNSNVKFLLTISPVPLTATASGRHVLTATTASKAILRAVADEMATSHDDVDYFPSYEIITGTPFRGMFYEPNQREVSAVGINFVMDHFFSCQNDKFNNVPRAAELHTPEEAMDILCEEAWLEEFGEDK